MKTLILIRHAKSSWEFPIQDKDRALIPRGIQDAKLVSEMSLPWIPTAYTIWCSTAKRASQTANIFVKHFTNKEISITYSEQLFTFDVEKLEKIIRKGPDDVKNLIIFGHNEAITNFVNKFGDIFIENVPTSGLVLLHFDTHKWADITKGKIIKTIFPKDLR